MSERLFFCMGFQRLFILFQTKLFLFLSKISLAGNNSFFPMMAMCNFRKTSYGPSVEKYDCLSECLL